MNEFKEILARLKEIISPHQNKKILDKDIATALNIKPMILASYKRRDTPPYKAILTYCHENRVDVRKVLFDESEPIIGYPKPVDNSKIQVRYFKTLEAYVNYLKKYPIYSSKILDIL